jgi:hypothetical protein
MLTLAGIWVPDAKSVFFAPGQKVTRREVVSALVRLRRAFPDAPEWPEYPKEPLFTDVASDDSDRALIEAPFLWGDFGKPPAEFRGNEELTWGAFNGLLKAMKLPEFPSLGGGAAKYALTRSECADYLYRVLQLRGEWLPKNGTWLQSGGDDDGDGTPDDRDPLPFDRDNDNVRDRLQSPSLKQVPAQ